MTAIDRTVYPRFTRPPTEHELTDLYTPTPEERDFAYRKTRDPLHRVHVLVLLKIVQRLDYVPDLADIPQPIVTHIHAQVDTAPVIDWALIDARTRRKHATAVRRYLGIHRADRQVRHRLSQALYTAATHMDNPADLINAAIEDLIRHRCELPAYSTFDDLTQRIRTQVNTSLFQQAAAQLTADHRTHLDQLLTVDPDAGRSGFARLKEPPPRASFRHLQWRCAVLWQHQRVV